MQVRTERIYARRARVKAVVLPALVVLAAGACSGGSETGENGEKPGTGPVITTVAGAGEAAGQEGEGISAPEAALHGPGAVVIDAEGNLYYSDEFGPVGTQRIRVVDQSGIVTTVAGNGSAGECSVKGPALDASIPGPHGLAFGSDGNLYFVSMFCFAVFRLDDDGTLTTIAGQPGVQSSFGGGPAAEAGFGGEPSQIAFDAEGNLYVTDFVAGQVRKIDTEGIITTIAGTGEVGSSGGGGPATQATLSGPDGLAIDAEGNIYVTEYTGHRVRKIDTQGIITTVAGTGEPGFSGDGGPAAEAQLYSPHDIEFDAEGNLYIVDEVNNRIRMIDAQGVISTVVGTAEEGLSGDGGPATATLHGPNSIAFDAAGNLYIADTTNDRIRMVAFAGA